MSSKAFRNKIRDRRATSSVWDLKTVAVLLTMVLCVSLLFLAVYKRSQSRTATLPKEFEGQIVDKWITFSDSESGSSRYYWLLVEVEEQRRFTVPVYRELYEHAQVGMRLKRSAKGLEVIRGSTGNKLP